MQQILLTHKDHPQNSKTLTANSSQPQFTRQKLNKNQELQKVSAVRKGQIVSKIKYFKGHDG